MGYIASTRRTATSAYKGTTSTSLIRGIRRLGALYYLASGVWPLVNMASFEFITGSKRDRWLVRTVGVLVAVIGATQLRTQRLPDASPRADTAGIELRQMFAAVAFGLAAIELYYWRRGTISVVYALDALGQLVLAAAWLVSEP